MLDRPAPEATVSGPPRRAAPRWPLAFVALAGLLGASGVVVGAAGAHLAAKGGVGGAGGADLARTASEFLLVHAAAVLAGSAAAPALRVPSFPSALPAGLLAAALALLALGAALFGGELAVAALADWRPLPLAAPAGGLCLVAGWLCLSGAGIAAVLVRPAAAL